MPKEPRTCAACGQAIPLDEEVVVAPLNPFRRPRRRYFHEECAIREGFAVPEDFSGEPYPDSKEPPN